MKFKVGQRVRMVKVNGAARIGDVGIIKSLTVGHHYTVEFPCLEGTNKGHSCDGLVPSGNGHWIDEEEMELASEQEEHMKITIETDGHHKTTAECNGITAESLCNPTDDFKLPKGVHMAVQRLLEKLERPDEDTCFHVGDTVEVVGYHNKFLKDIVGKRGVVTRIDEHAREKYEIRYEENICGSNKWWSHPEELKLISKEDVSFHVGDIVEVVNADGYKFFDKVKGIQGVIVSYYSEYVCEVKLPLVVSKKDTWCYHTRALKLIRRGNN